MQQTIQNILRQATQLLKEIETPRLDAEILLAHVLQKPRSYLFASPEYQLTATQHLSFQSCLARRLKGESIAHILGEKEFWSLSLEVTPDTLIPRPDTELLVELTLQTLSKTTPQKVADLGTGSGAIALALAKECAHWHIIATDNYPATLAVAKRNAIKLGLPNLHFYVGNWCDALPPDKLNAIVSNPPYIAADDPHLNSPALSFEPQQALVSGSSGLDALNQIIAEAKLHLIPGGWLLLEHGFDQALTVQQQMREVGYQHISTHHDLGGHPRVTMGQFGLDEKI